MERLRDLPEFTEEGRQTGKNRRRRNKEGGGENRRKERRKQRRDPSPMSAPWRARETATSWRSGRHVDTQGHLLGAVTLPRTRVDTGDPRTHVWC